MSAFDYVASIVVPAALRMLPDKMDSPAARAEILAIGLQESRFKYRRQMRGPAISFWQGEATGGMVAVFNHSATCEVARDVLQRMGYGDWDPSDFQAMEDNDILACIAARLLLWTHPKPLPEGDIDTAWDYYLATWRPGKPYRETWDGFYARAWETVHEI